MHTAMSETLFLVLQTFMTRVFRDRLFVGFSWVCFLVKVLLVLDGLVLLHLLLLFLCLRGEVAKGGLSGSLQSDVDKSNRIEKLFASSMDEFEKSELAKFGMPHLQQIQETWLFWRALYANVDIPMQSTWYQELHWSQQVAR